MNCECPPYYAKEDAALSHFCPVHGLPEYRAQRRGRPVWVTRDGRKLTPEEMSDGHLRNTIAFIERRLGRAARALKTLGDLWWVFTPGPSGEHAQDCFEQAQAEVWEREWQDYLPPIYDALVNELARRGNPTEADEVDP